MRYLDAANTVTLNLFQGLTYTAPSKIKILKQVQHDGISRGIGA